ncbi:glia maturation factor gamma-like [Oscarella lobularis]|uniref:glia maturation factor gamma-like n=1 Tax=Oscarella lobularis TaxID=121494 RepID=UPI0033138BCA
MAAPKVCDMDPELKEKLKKFRFRKAKNNAAIIMKIDPKNLIVKIDEEHEDMTLEEVAEELPERQPRYVAYSCELNHGDGRISYPLCFIFVSPEGCKPETMMMYAGSKLNVINEGKFTKDFELREKEEMTNAWLKDRLLAK